MKHTLALFALLLFALSLIAQLPVDSATQKITYVEIVEVDSTSKDDLYFRAREWVANAFVFSQDVIQMASRESGKIVGKGAIELNQYSAIKFTLTLDFKDNRYRYVATNFHHSGSSFDCGDIELEKNGFFCSKMSMRHFRSKTHEVMTEAIASLKKTMNQEEDSW